MCTYLKRHGNYCGKRSLVSTISEIDDLPMFCKVHRKCKTIFVRCRAHGCKAAAGPNKYCSYCRTCRDAYEREGLPRPNSKVECRDIYLQARRAVTPSTIEFRFFR